MIQQSLSLASEALQALPAHVAVVDASGQIVFVNEAWRRFASANGGAADSGSSVGANYLAVCRDAVGRGDLTARDALQGLEAVLRGRQPAFALEYPCHAPGEERWFRMSVTPFHVGSEVYLVAAHDDITAQKLSERALKETERLLRSVLEALPVGVWILDAEGRIVQGNAAGVRIWGGARYVGPKDFGEYKGWWVATGEPIAPEEWAAARAISRGETSIDEEVEIQCFDGTRKIIFNSAIPLYDSDRRLAGAIIANQDITARKRAEREREALLREHERLRKTAIDANRMKDDFIAALSHELRTPLQSVLGWAEILKRMLPDSPASARALAAVERNARILANLLNDTLDLSRIARGKLSVDRSDVDLVQIVGDVVEGMRPSAAEKGIALTERTSVRRAIVHGDATRLQQVVWNLLSNALKFTPGGGRVEVSLSMEDRWAAVAVQDTGAGIAPEFMPHLFERFSQGEDSTGKRRLGLGLGLAIVKELVDLHGGAIEAGSAGEGQGATFTVRLPLLRT